MHTDNNFPAALQVLAFLGSAVVLGILLLVSAYGYLRKRAWAWRTLALFGAGCILYALVLMAFSMFSNDTTLARGEEKYFCEIDCHLAYSVTDAKWIQDGSKRSLAVTLRTRFDETTISAHRPKDVPLAPSPREILLVDASGRKYNATASQGTSLEQALTPGQEYTTTLIFPAPQNTTGMKLLITAPEGPVPLLIGHEMSLGHKKTYLGL